MFIEGASYMQFTGPFIQCIQAVFKHCQPIFIRAFKYIHADFIVIGLAHFWEILTNNFDFAKTITWFLS